MRKANAKSGSSSREEHLCLRCSWGQCMTGYRDSDRRVICTNSQPNMLVPFPVLECTSFHDKHHPDWRQMDSLAIDIEPVHTSCQTAGLSVVAEEEPLSEPHVDEQEEREERDEAAFVRWIITNLTQKDPAGDYESGYIW